MDYKLLNKIQKDRMRSISNHSYTMKWEKPEFMDFLMGELPKIRKYQSDKGLEKEIESLEKIILAYNSFSTEQTSFLDEVSKCILDIQRKKESWNGISLYEIKSYVKMHRFCLISGEGGIGKSYFIKCFEEQLTQKNIPHLCVYGKFEKNTDNIDIEQIIETSNSGFVFIVDAINEMTEKGQNDLLTVLKKFKSYPKIRIIISYRTNSMDNLMLEKYKRISEYEYKFSGVSFESALNEILKLSVPDIYMYEDILYSNNALLLGMLCDILSSSKLVEETENGIASVTFILEQYIKKTIDRIFKNSLTCRGTDVWKDTKRVANWMYVAGEKNIDEESLLSIIKTGNNFLPSMIQMGFMDVYEVEGIKYYYFVIDSLTDFLIARSLFEDIKNRDVQEQIGIIKEKIKALYSLEEAVVIAIFDNMSPDYAKIKEILEATGLIERLHYNTLVKIHFKRENIIDFLKTFRPANPSDLLKAMGGYTDKPFNCSNYLFEYYLENNKKVGELSHILEGHYFQDEIKNRLKNVLYFTTLNDREDRRDDEAFYFALLCCSAPNKAIRCLAMKLLYEVVSKSENYQKKIIVEYRKISDFYVKEAIIYVLSQLQKNDTNIITFFNEIIVNDDSIVAKSIRRISSYLGDKYSFINWNRKNLFSYKKSAYISNNLNEILSFVDLMAKDFFPFRYWGKNHVDMYIEFLKNDKGSVIKVNNYLSEKYSCVRSGNCNGWMGFEDIVMKEIQPMVKIKTLDKKSFFQSFEKVIKYVFSYYGIVSKEKELNNIEGRNLANSTYMKCIDIANGLYYGSLMCNYFTNQFATYNNYQNNIGYEVYDPLEYGEDINITAPIPTYQDNVERLGDIVVNSLEIPENHDIKWVKDVELTRKNVLTLLKTIEYKHQEWVMLAGRISVHKDTQWRDTYDVCCCFSKDESIKDDGNARYLTIELEEYIGELKAYSSNNLKPWLCKEVKSISSSDVEVFEETSLVLPPSTIIKFFNLILNLSDLSWETQDKSKVIMCNNNKSSYYKDPIRGTVFIQKNYLDEFLKSHSMKYFVFTERFIPETGYANETSLHFEIINGNIEKEIKNYGRLSSENNTVNSLCENCPHTNIKRYKNKESIDSEMEWLDNLLKEYGNAWENNE